MKKYHFGLVPALISLALVGCASTGPQYYKAATSQEQFQRDIWECQQIVNQSYQSPASTGNHDAFAAIGHGLGRAMSEKGRHRDCMYGRGYQVQR